MLEVYLKYLNNGCIPYLWNKKMNLLEDVPVDKIFRYKEDIEEMLYDIKLNPSPQTVLKYLRSETGLITSYLFIIF